MARTQLTISDHAMLRYLERMKGIDMDAVKQEILSYEGVAGALQIGAPNGKYPMADGFRAVIQNNTLITILRG